MDLPQIELQENEILVLSTNSSLEMGLNEADDWENTEELVTGLFGLAWGEGDNDFTSWNVELDNGCVLKVNKNDGYIDLSSQVKFKKGEVIFKGKRNLCIDLLYKHAPKNTRINWLNLEQGNEYAAVLVGGHESILIGGRQSTIISGSDSIITSGDFSNITSGDISNITSGDFSNITSGSDSTIHSGDESIITSGVTSIIITGYKSIVYSSGYGTIFYAKTGSILIQKMWETDKRVVKKITAKESGKTFKFKNGKFQVEA